MARHQEKSCSCSAASHSLAQRAYQPGLSESVCPVQVAKAIEDWIEEQVMQLDDNKCALLGSRMRSQLLFDVGSRMHADEEQVLRPEKQQVRCPGEHQFGRAVCANLA